MRKIIIFILMLPMFLMADSTVDTICHLDSIYDCILSTQTSHCCTETSPTEDCQYINSGNGIYLYLGGTASVNWFNLLVGFHLGGRSKTDLDSVIFAYYSYSDYDVDSTLELRVNPLINDIVTLTDTLQYRYGHYSFDQCESEINDSSPTGRCRIRDYDDGVCVTWLGALYKATKKGNDFDGNVEDSITINGTGWKRIPITNCVIAAIDSGNTFCDMLLRDKESYQTTIPFHTATAKYGGGQSFYSIQWYYVNPTYAPKVIFYYSTGEEEAPSRRRQILLDQ